jgi:hypothetical protein
MLIVMVEQPRLWHLTGAERLERSPGRWHYRCAPTTIRKYAPTVFGLSAHVVALHLPGNGT